MADVRTIVTRSTKTNLQRVNFIFSGTSPSSRHPWQSDTSSLLRTLLKNCHFHSVWLTYNQDTSQLRTTSARDRRVLRPCQAFQLYSVVFCTCSQGMAVKLLARGIVWVLYSCLGRKISKAQMNRPINRDASSPNSWHFHPSRPNVDPVRVRHLAYVVTFLIKCSFPLIWYNI
jgi:hypothetical protein